MTEITLYLLSCFLLPGLCLGAAWEPSVLTSCWLCGANVHKQPELPCVAQDQEAGNKHECSIANKAGQAATAAAAAAAAAAQGKQNGLVAF